MNEPIWINTKDCISLHSKALSWYGGLSGIRDESLLESALNRPKQLFSYESPTLFQLAGAYAFGIVKNHPFLDGNKRSGFLCAALFLEMNGLRFIAPEEEVVLHTFALAAGEEGEEEYATWLKTACEQK